MKNTYILLVIGLLFISAVHAQETSNYEYKNALKISPIEFARSKFQFSYERYFGDRSSSFLIFPGIILKEEGANTQKGIELMSQYRFFLTHLKKGTNKTLGFYNIGFYAGPYALGLNYNEDYEAFFYNPTTGMSDRMMFKKDVQSYEGGVMIGVQFDITPRILLDFYVGGGIRQGTVNDTYTDANLPNEYNYTPIYGVFDEEYTGVKPKLGLQLGISF